MEVKKNIRKFNGFPFEKVRRALFSIDLNSLKQKKMLDNEWWSVLILPCHMDRIPKIMKLKSLV